MLESDNVVTGIMMLASSILLIIMFTMSTYCMLSESRQAKLKQGKHFLLKKWYQNIFKWLLCIQQKHVTQKSEIMWSYCTVQYVICHHYLTIIIFSK
jgi:hypothetical protein